MAQALNPAQAAYVAMRERAWRERSVVQRALVALATLALLGTCAVPRMLASEGGPRSTQAGSAQAAAQSAPPAPVRADFVITGDVRQGGLLRGQVPSGTTSLMWNGERIAFDKDGFFLLGLDRDAPLEGRLEAWRDAGEPVIRRFDLAAGNWRIQHVAVAFNGPATPEEYKAKRPKEIEEMAASRAIKVESEGWRQRFIWPLTGRISGVFGSQRVYKGTPGNYHNGVDVARPIGTPIVAPADGVVVLAADRPFTLEGYLLIIDHGMGLVSTFLHNNALAVKKGDVVRQGQLIGWVGTTGRSTGPHMHWGMRWQDKRIDPMLVAGPMPQAPAAPASRAAAQAKGR